MKVEPARPSAGQTKVRLKSGPRLDENLQEKSSTYPQSRWVSQIMRWDRRSKAPSNPGPRESGSPCAEVQSVRGEDPPLKSEGQKVLGRTWPP